MKRAVSILILFFICQTVWCSQTAIGVDGNKVIIWEYWKFEDGIGNNEMMIFNPTREKTIIIFRKWYQKKKDDPERVYTESDILLRTKKIRPNQYFLFKNAAKEIRAIHRGLIEVLVNGKTVGLYDLTREEKAPVNKIEEGIIINQRSNTGSYLPYEIIYKRFKFKRNKTKSVKVAYLEKDFHSSGFVKGEKFNPYGIDLKNIFVKNLKIGDRENFDLDLLSTGKTGTFELRFTNIKSKQRIIQRNFNHMMSKGRGQTIAFNIPNGVCFNKKRKYKKRK